MTRRNGQCLCGAVRISAEVSEGIGACHCTQCQRWTGGGPFYALRVEGLEVSGDDHIAAYRHSDHGERNFCRVCGSTLWWRMQDHPVAFVAPGLLNDQTGLAVTEEIFTDTRAPWQEPVPGASQSTEAEELAKLDAFLSRDQT